MAINASAPLGEVDAGQRYTAEVFEEWKKKQS
jgi:hypothetical protein